MANDTVITIIGNTTGPAELRFTPAGAAVANFTIASTPRTFDRNSNEWKDGTTLFLRCSAWRELAENVAETLGEKGMRVIASGRLTQREYEKDGQKRTVVELEVDEIGPSLKYANAKVNRTQRNGNNAPAQQQPAAQGQGGLGGQPSGSGGWGAGPTNEPAF
ncbi:single-stranded DNA-binding protein [Pseudarthrobacter oxydans]|uniref:single-stranded DNA-binding protein n=1 Tax=Pseudarthrobacter oxydans TaxID=1671 RepID=UPI003432B425